MPKFIQMKFPDGATFEVDARWVAELRADYYVDVDFRAGEVSNIEKATQDEIEYALNDPGELLDYFANNLDWHDIQKRMKQVSDANPQRYEDDWASEADMSVVEHD